MTRLYRCAGIIAVPSTWRPLKRFHGNLVTADGAANRAFPVAVWHGHRWVSPAPVIWASRNVRGLPPSEMFEFADEQVNLPLDPEQGPAWRLALQTVHGWLDGCAADRLALHRRRDRRLFEICDAVGGRAVICAIRHRTLGRGRTRALRCVPDAGEISRTSVVRSRRRSGWHSAAEWSVVPDRLYPTRQVAPTASRCPLSRWRSTPKPSTNVPKPLGNSHSLVAGFAVKLAARLGRVRADDGAGDSDDSGQSAGFRGRYGRTWSR